MGAQGVRADRKKEGEKQRTSTEGPLNTRLGATSVVSSRLPPYHAEPPSQDHNAPKLMIEPSSTFPTRKMYLSNTQGVLARVVGLVLG